MVIGQWIQQTCRCRHTCIVANSELHGTSYFAWTHFISHVVSNLITGHYFLNLTNYFILLRFSLTRFMAQNTQKSKQSPMITKASISH